MREFQRKVQTLCFVIPLVAAALAFVPQIGKGDVRYVTVGAKNNTEQHVLAEILAQLIEAKTDLKVKRLINLDGTTICYCALQSKTIDVYFEYTGTALLDIFKQPLQSAPLYPYLKEAFAGQGLAYLFPLQFTNRYVLITREEAPMQQLSDIDEETKLAIDPEFAARKELHLLKEVYCLPKRPTLMDQVLLYFSLESGAQEVISASSTDARLFTEKYRILEDREDILPHYQAAPLVRQELIDTYPELKKVFSLLADRVADKEILELNYQVEIGKIPVSEAVHSFLENGILSG